MPTTVEHTVQHTGQVTRDWVRDLNTHLEWADEPHAFRLLRVTLQALRDWLDVDEAAQFSAQLPLLLRGIYFEGWNPGSNATIERSRDAFLARIEAAFREGPMEDLEEAVCCVFKLLNDRISEGEIRDIRMRLPKSLRELWPEPNVVPLRLS